MRYDDAIAKAKLTKRQRRVLDYYLAGHTITRIALATGLAESTVRGHLKAALRKIKPYLRKDAA